MHVSNELLSIKSSSTEKSAGDSSVRIFLRVMHWTGIQKNGLAVSSRFEGLLHTSTTIYEIFKKKLFCCCIKN